MLEKALSTAITVEVAIKQSLLTTIINNTHRNPTNHRNMFWK